MRLSERSLEVAGGVILLIIAIRMIFSHERRRLRHAAARASRFIFPLAVPLLAGPSAMATVLLLASRQPERLWQWIGALALRDGGVGRRAARAPTASAAARRLDGGGIEKLMGLVLTAIAVEMILAGLKRYFFEGG